MTGVAFDTVTEFDRQVARLIALGYPELAGTTAERFVRELAPLREAVASLVTGEHDPERGRVAFALVVTRQLVPIEETMPRTTLRGKDKPGFVDRSFEEGALERFVAPDPVSLPNSRAYLLLDVDRGEEFCGVVPADAMRVVADRERTVLTIEEGIALLTLFPEVLVKNKCYMLGGSRCGDRRVPALWISRNAPKLGWCWEGNPHTWLGMASAGGRVAVSPRFAG
ncbi:DUF5701 family protein [Saccharomonospora glauca]|uniref:Uncharacterized protein n=1 Tax=Saccharomonospora glauca K62 TaxID=928724 RepID=I1CXP8_9PSEU|nr:DUF5701 family protein [Saccharomonospora glauca]EIE97472.1 hypothetical protein SacglDRAFT_00521 [Saccharomonospora glauca K62]